MPGVEKIEILVVPSKVETSRMAPHPVHSARGAHPPETEGTQQQDEHHPGRAADAISLFMDGEECILEPTD